jgi:hypothetical protein
VLVIGDWLLEIPTIFHPASSSLFVVAKPIPFELPTINACRGAYNSPSSTTCHQILTAQSLTFEDIPCKGQMIDPAPAAQGIALC